ncbi:MAG: acyltransferase family protein, partial [Steroidobacteraceae bacterium]
MERDRIPELDLLRFIAAAGVVLFHLTHWPMQPNLLTQIFTYGAFGVPLFFMISGFVILMTAQNRTGIGFVNSRIARLYPSFWIAVLLSSLALTLLDHEPASTAVIAANLTMHPHAFNHQPYLDMVYWTLVVELKFYALTWLVIVTRQMRRVESLLTLWLAITAFAIWIRIPHWLDAIVMPMYASLFAGGCYLYLIRSRGANARRLIMFAASVPLSIYWTMQYQHKYTHSTSLETQLTVIAVLLAMSIVLLLLALRRWSLPPARLWFWLGCLTYPLYLIHAKPGNSVFLRLGGDEWPRMWLVLALVLLVSGVLAAVVERRLCPALHKFLERTAQRLLEKLGRRRED